MTANSLLTTAFSRAELISAIEKGARPKYVLFWGHTGHPDKAGPYVLSQWRATPFSVNGVVYPTAEHFMMAEKAHLFGDEAIREEILASTDPGRAKALGRKVTGYDEARWQAARFDIVVRGSLAKFGQTGLLRDYLSSTGTKVLVEASPQDTIWGAGLARDDDRISDPRTWRGENLLGFALMKARAILASTGRSA